MNERTLRDRLHALAPLILRLGIAAVLAQDGLRRMTSAGQGPILETAAASPETSPGPESGPGAAPEGFTLRGKWASVMGVGELGAAAMLVAGFFTRLCAVPMLAVLGYCTARTLGWAGGSIVPPGSENLPAMLLLGVACLTLLVSGSGCASWDSFRWSRKRKGIAAGMVA